MLAEQTLRDERDSTREHSPLRPAPGAITLDTTDLPVEDVVARIAALAAGPEPQPTPSRERPDPQPRAVILAG